MIAEMNVTVIFKSLYHDYYNYVFAQTEYVILSCAIAFGRISYSHVVQECLISTQTTFCQTDECN